MGEMRKAASRSSSKKKNDGKSRKSGGSGKPKDRASTKSKTSKRLSDRFHGMEDTTPRISHLRKTLSDSRLNKAKSIPSLESDENKGNSKTLAETASAVTTHLSSAITKLADITSDFLYPSKSRSEEKPGLVDTSMDTTSSTPQSIRLKLETTFSTITSELDCGDRSKKDNSFNSDYDNSILEKDTQTPTRKKADDRRKSFSEEKKVDSPQFSYPDGATPDRSFDSQQSTLPPPPHILEGNVHTTHSSSQKIVRPVPLNTTAHPLLKENSDLTGTTGSLSTPSRVYPKREDEYAFLTTTPMARMRHVEAQKAAAVEDVTPHRSKSDDEVKKEKQRKWRRRMKLAEKKREKERRELYDDATSAVATTATGTAGPCKDGLRAVFLDSATSPVRMIQQMIRTRCGALEDSLSFDSGDEESQSAASQESEDMVTTEDEEESVDGTSRQTDRNISQETSMYTESLASESRSLFTLEEERTGSQLTESQDEERTGPQPTSEEERTGQRPTSTSEGQEQLTACDGSVTSSLGTLKMELNDKNFIKTFIMDSSKDGVPLLWHVEEPISNSFSRPSPVMCFLAFGSKGQNGAFEGPRLLWVMSDGTRGDSIDLFDIRSLEKASPLQLQAYPFAIPGRSIVVRCSTDKEMVFEAPNEGEALRFIHGMRWVVARLAFNLIIGNLDVCCELLNVTRGEDERKHPQSLQEEAQWARAMNEVTHQLVEKSIFQTAE